nr:54s ribosomal protein l4, mitochondrial [Quercus suber]
MALPHCTCKGMLNNALIANSSRTYSLPPSFLLPAFIQTSAFSTSICLSARKDGNPNRGVSALRRTGLNKKQRLSITDKFLARGLPKPVLDPAKRSRVEVDPDHGLWDFFSQDGSAFDTPSEMASHGREWTIEELKAKDWDDLHRLWWVCAKEKNRLATGEVERKAAAGKGMYGEYEYDQRFKTVKKTQKNIRIVLTTRFYAWEDARNAAMEDPEVDLYADPEQGEHAYLPGQQEEQTIERPEGSTAAQVAYVPETPATQSQIRV